MERYDGSGDGDVNQIIEEKFGCLLKEKKCDGVKDCVDGVDEDPSNCGQYQYNVKIIRYSLT